MLLFTKLAAPKAPKRRSRAGCTSCKEKKKKCDEERPKCARCAERGGECVYEPVRPRQRRKRDGVVSSATTSASTADSGGGGLDADNNTKNTTNNARPNGINGIPTDSFAWPLPIPDEYDDGYDEEDDMVGGDVTTNYYPNALTQSWVQHSNTGHPSWRPGPLVLDEGGFSDDACDLPIFSPVEDGFDIGSLVPPPMQHSGVMSGVGGRDMTMSPVMKIGGGGGAYDDEAEEGDLVVRSIGMEQHVKRRSSFASTTTIRTIKSEPTPSTAITSASNYHRQRRHHELQQGNGFGGSTGMAVAASMLPVRSPLLEFCAPAFSEFSVHPGQRLLVDHFCNVLSHLIVFREETGNPFQQLVLPLMTIGTTGVLHPYTAGSSSPVADAVYALASAHLEHRGVEVEGGDRSLYYHQRAIQGLSKLIQSSSAKSVNKNQVLAAIILLVYYEVLVQRSRTGIIEGHLRGALTVMCSNPEPLDSTGVFLERAFRFYDVIAALSFGTAPLSTAPGAGCLLPFPPVGAPAASPLNNVDTLLGMSTTLWPIIHRLSGLLALKTDLEAARAAGYPAKVAVLRTEFESTAAAVEAALLGWAPCPPAGWALNPEVEGGDPTKLRRATSPTATGFEGVRRGSYGSVGGLCDETVVGDMDGPGTGNGSRLPEDLFSPESAAALDQEAPSPSSAATPASTSSSSASSSSNSSSSSSSSASSTSDSARLHSILNNALAYRHSALVYLYRTVQSRPSSHPLVQRHARRALRHCSATVEHGGAPWGALPVAAIPAACEARSPTTVPPPAAPLRPSTAPRA
ncbi:hypothetical protein MAPG_00097 [Magnaporthiopsis poae ATCC 64411]|uniref:Zn(2)-C6 fungal-type domain-containing protein n=1 Tax=Magnaporthiopsis poae (strain ATCC 64411 / 73-15) TaxID=644358 RepID=A0A0C4DK35_MAGP6|nr:hypothetical protein MAPG_00097 [Magnaporthiopsis poae ATCC 64411]